MISPAKFQKYDKNHNSNLIGDKEVDDQANDDGTEFFIDLSVCDDLD